MKKLLLLSNLLVLSVLANAQTSLSLTDGQSALIYSLPKTELCIEVTVEKSAEKPGMFYRYSERYLATNKIITEEKTNCKLLSVTVKSRELADSNRTYSFIPTRKSVSSHITVNDKGILCGVNLSQDKREEKKVLIEKTIEMENPTNALLPLGEEFMMAGSEAKLAEGAAKQIYRIRESRLGILTADVEHMPADGLSFKTLMNGLNKMETELTELFVGKTTREIITKQIYFTPTAAINNEVLFRLSAFNGIVAKDDLSGKPFYITITPSTIPVVEADPKAKKETAALYYLQPASTQINIDDGINTLYTEKMDIPQFGKVIPLSADFVEQPNLKIRFDAKTGRLLSVE